MSIARLVPILVFAVAFSPRGATAAETIYVFKAGLTLPVVQPVVRPNEDTDVVISRKLSDKDLVNLALGRPLGSKVDGKREILAWAGTFEPLISPTPHARLIVFDPSQNGLAKVRVTVARVRDVEYGTAYLASKSDRAGAAALLIEPTVGSPADALLGGTLHGSGTLSGAHITQINGEFVPPSLNGKAIVGGRIQFRIGGAAFDGFVTFGKAKVSGKLLGTFEE